jgi:hypothetical protein
MIALDCNGLRRGVRRAALKVLAVALAWAAAPAAPLAHAQSPKTPWQNLTPAQMSAVWWQWAYSIPVTGSPLFDNTGASFAAGQPYFTAPGGSGNLLFLGGTFTSSTVDGNVVGEVTRTITIKQGTGVFFPIINTEWDNSLATPHLGGPPPKGQKVLGVPQLQALAAAQVANVTGLFATLTPTDQTFTQAGRPIDLGSTRLVSPPFGYTLPAKDNLAQYFGINISGQVAPACSDGYWSGFPGTVAPGYYLLRFGGTVPLDNMGHTFTERITYQIIIAP